MTERNATEDQRLERRRPATARRVVGLLGRLESYRKQSGLIIGELYALTARALLKRLEAVEDLQAERRFRQRSRPPSPPAAASLSGAADTAASSPSPLETSS